MFKHPLRLLWAIALVGATSLHAQVSAALRGRVADATGAPVSSATVTLTSDAEQTSRTTMTMS